MGQPDDPTILAAEETLTRTLAMRGIDPRTLRPREDGTIAVPPPSPADASKVAGLPPLLGGDSGPQIELRGAQIGIGGMSQVALALQVPLEREVAVKVVRSDRINPRIADALLREAQVLGALEHPNIVPVYMLGREDRDLPAIVMKRVVGTAWSEFIGQGEPSRAPDDVPDPLEWNISILMQVCNAVHYAHAKGVLHRDVKPSNVMIGEFGEVYLMDWGIAVALGRSSRLGLPAAADVMTVAGTPGFMAPEMAMADGGQIDQRTDVYLLGACLHTVLTGLPRHTGATPVNAMASAFLSEPYEYGPEVPVELGAICNRAMARDPAERYESAEQLRQALAEALRHGTSIRLAREAKQKLRALRRITTSTAPEDGTRRRTYDLFTECRFAFREALRQWKDNEEARDGLQGALEVMASFEIEQKSFQAAAALIAELPRPNEALSARLAALQQQRASEARKIEEWKQLEHDADTKVGGSERKVMLLLIGIIYSSFYFALGFLRRYEIFTWEYEPMFIVLVSYGSLVEGFHLAFRRVLRKNQVNRRFGSILRISVVASLAYWLPAWHQGVEFAPALATLLMIYCCSGLGLCVLVEIPLAPAFGALGAGAVACILWPYWCYEAMGASIVAFSIIVTFRGPGTGRAKKKPSATAAAGR